MIEFIAAVYNEELEIDDLITHAFKIADCVHIMDDCSTDGTTDRLDYNWWGTDLAGLCFTWHQMKEHSGLPETVKHEALQMVQDGSWVILLDADERFTDKTIEKIEEFFRSGESKNWDYVYFNQLEIIDGVHVRTFQKCKLFRKEAITFPLNNIHADDQFTGRGTYFGWEVLHRKSTNKQITRETEYLATYKKLLAEGKIDEGRYQWLVGLHHYVKPKG